MIKGIIFDFNRTLFNPDEGKLFEGVPFLLEWALSFGFEPEEVLVVGDRVKSEIKLANELGMVSVWLKKGKRVQRKNVVLSLSQLGHSFMPLWVLKVSLEDTLSIVPRTLGRAMPI